MQTKYIRIQFIVFISVILNSCQTVNGQTRNETLKSIRQEFQRINSDTSLKIKTFDDPEEFLGYGTDGGGQLTGYFRKDTICKIRIIVGLSYGEIENEYYFNNGQLIFVYEVERNFPYNDTSGSINHEKLNVAFEGRYYFDNHKLIQKAEKGKRRFENEKTTSSALLKDAKDYMTFLNSKKR